MKKPFLVISCLSVGLMFCSHSAARSVEKEKDKIILESPLLSLIDGKSFGVDAINFGVILKQRLDLRRRIYGIALENGQRVGFFEFEGKKVTLLDLCKIESKIESDYNAKMSYLEKNKSLYTSGQLAKERKKITDDYNSKKNALRKCLDLVKEDFIEISVVYADSAKGIKDLLMGIVQEFVDKKGLKETFLLSWGSLEPGQEEDSIRKNLTSFKDFTRFCIDLIGFIEAMANSCPKGKALFIEMIKKARQSK